MSGPRITLLESQDAKLRSWLTTHPAGHERGAILLLRRFDRPVEGLEASARFVVADIIQMTDDWIIDSSPTSLRINLRKFPDVYYRCENEGLALGFAHGHPEGYLGFSERDDQNELNIMRGYVGSNGTDSTFVSMVLSDGQWIGRVRNGKSPNGSEQMRHVACLGERLSIYEASDLSVETEILKRQEAAFGKPFNRKLQSLRAVVVGAGGTGSSAATLLARAGVGELVIVDADLLEHTNLNRVRGHRAENVGENKAKVLAEYIRSLGLKIAVSWIGEYLDKSPAAVDALSSADVVFGCTDDVAGRDILNQALYYYGLAYIDTGLTGRVDTDANGEPYLRDHRGRVSCILPEHGACLRCQRVVTDAKLQYEQALEERPELALLDAETLEREYYLVGGGEQAPGVGPFTSATADAAVATLMDLIKPFRSFPSDIRRDNIWQDFVHLTVYSNEPVDDAECIYCRQHQLLLRGEGKYRLEMPALGAL